MELESDSCDSWDVAFEAEQEAEPNHDAPALQEAQDSRDAATQPTLYSHSAQRQRKKGRGRPAGSFGSNQFREILREQADADRNQTALRPIQIARQAKEQKLKLAKQAASAQSDSAACSNSNAAGLTHTGRNLVLQEYAVPKDLALCAGNSLHQDLIASMSGLLLKNKDPEDSVTHHQLEGAMSALSFKAFERLTGENNIGRKILSIAGCLLELTLAFFGAFLNFIAMLVSNGGDQTSYQQVMTVLRLRYDETPHKVKVMDTQNLSTNLATASNSEVALANALGSSTSSLHAKILQIECCFGCLLSPSDKDNNTEFCWVEGRVPASLYAVESTTGSNTFKALRDVTLSLPGWDTFSQKSKLNLRHSCTDRYAANNVAERMLSSVFESSTHTHLGCDVHRLYQCLKNAFFIVEGDISGALAVGLACGDPGAVHAMRQVLARVFSERLEIIEGMPPNGLEKQHREAVLNTFLPIINVEPSKKKSNLQRRFVINFFLTGKLWLEPILHHCSWACCPNPDATLRFMTVFLAWALIPTRCPIFPRSRWTRVDSCFDWLGLLSACHNLLEPVVYHVTGKPKKAPEPQLPVHADDDAPKPIEDWDEIFNNVQTMSCASAAAPASVPLQAPLPEPSDPFSDLASTALGQAERDFATDEAEAQNSEPQIDFDDNAVKKERKKNKKKARAWVDTAPFCRLVAIKEILSAFMPAMYAFLRLSGEVWEKRQRLTELKSGHRTYRILEAYLNKAVQEAMEKLNQIILCRPGAVLQGDFSPRLRSILFRMAARCMCSLHVLLALPRRGFPFRMFSALGASEADLANGVFQAHKCSYDSLSNLLFETYDSWFQCWLLTFVSTVLDPKTWLHGGMAVNSSQFC